MKLMDYSLFLYKLTLSKEEAMDLFGDEIKEKQDKDFNELMIQNSIRPSFLTEDNKKNLNIDFDKLNFNEEIKPKKSIKEKGKIYHDIKYYKQYLFPSLIPGTAYILAIIDYFQYFNFYKYVESGIKTRFWNKKEKEVVSCVDPKTYSNRFIKYFQQLTDIKHILKDGQKNDTIKNNEDEKDYKTEDFIKDNNDTNLELKHFN